MNTNILRIIGELSFKDMNWFFKR